MFRTLVSSSFAATLALASACTDGASPPLPDDEPTPRAATPDVEPAESERTATPMVATLIRAANKDALTLRAGIASILEIDVDDRAGFATQARSDDSSLNVGRFVARLPGGLQTSLDADELIATRRVSLTVDRPGAAMVMLCVGPDGADASDAWQRVTYCSKTIYRVDHADGTSPGDYEDPGVMTKAALPIELLPVMSPLHITPGSDMAVRGYLFGHAGEGRQVVAVRPDGSRDEQTTNRIGLANFRITQAGRWVIRLEAQHEGRDVIGELVFDVHAASAHDGGVR